MVVRIFISGISGNKEVKKRQQRVVLILDSKSVKYEVIDIAEPGNEELKEFMQNKSTASGGTISDPNPRHPLPPQIFNDDIYCGDYDQFDMANEIDEMEKFLKMAPDDSAPTQTSSAELKLGNGVGSDLSEEINAKEEIDEAVPNESNETNAHEDNSKNAGDEGDKVERENAENDDE